MHVNHRGIVKMQTDSVGLKLNPIFRFSNKIPGDAEDVIRMRHTLSRKDLVDETGSYQSND